MEIIVRLREERAALVARVAQIDKMLRQFDDWGREAQQLLSLTAEPKGNQPVVIEPIDSTVAESQRNEFPHTDAPPTPLAKVGPEASSSAEQSAKKTPIPEFEAALIEVLRESGRPMDRVELYSALTARGIVIGAGDRAKDLNALSARVYRLAQNPKNRIFGVRGEGYRLEAGDTADSQNVVIDDLL